MRLILAFAASALLAMGSVAHADTYSYVFTTDFGYDFTYISPVLIATDTTFTPLTCTDNYAACDTVTLDPPEGLIELPDSLFVGRSPAFFTVGTHTEYEATMTISDVPSVSATPEPSSLALLGTGILGVAGVIRRRHNTTN